MRDQSIHSSDSDYRLFTKHHKFLENIFSLEVNIIMVEKKSNNSKDPNGGDYYVDRTDTNQSLNGHTSNISNTSSNKTINNENYNDMYSDNCKY